MENIATNVWDGWKLAADVKNVLNAAKSVILADERDELVDLSVGGKGN